MTTRSERVEGSVTDPLDQRVAMTAPSSDHLEGSGACPSRPARRNDEALN